MGRTALWMLTALAACGRLNFDPLGGDGGGATSACFQQLAAGDRLTCALRGDSTVWCAGWNTSGQLGANRTATALYHSAVPLAVIESTTGQPLVDATNVVTTNFAGCVHKTDGSVWCWGYNSTGAVGDGTNTDRIAAVETLPAGSATAIAAGWRHVCAIRPDATLSCWGHGTSGELGDGANMNYRTPMPVPGLANVTSMTGGLRMTCARVAGSLRCWGDNAFGQLGDGTLMAHSTPSPVQASIDGLVRTTHGREHGCGIDASGNVWCWGALRAAHDRGTTNVTLLQTYGTAPVQILADAIAVDSGSIHVCAIRTDHTVWCWGSNSHGQLGDGTLTDSLTPVQVIDDSAAPLTGVLEIAVGARHSCARRTDGTIWCWGWGVEGQLANGSYPNTTSRAQPTLFACP